jgi:hypothetical protein
MNQWFVPSKWLRELSDLVGSLILSWFTACVTFCVVDWVWPNIPERSHPWAHVIGLGLIGLISGSVGAAFDNRYGPRNHPRHWLLALLFTSVPVLLIDSSWDPGRPTEVGLLFAAYVLGAGTQSHFAGAKQARKALAAHEETKAETH